MNANELDGYGVADLNIRHELRQEGGHRPTRQERMAWSKLQAERQEAEQPIRRGNVSIFGITFGKH
jgi:hypothetical protein